MKGLADAWAAEGHEVVVYTQTSNKAMNGLHYEVIRQYNGWQLLLAMRRADIIVEANISLYSCWIGTMFRKKWFVIHHLPYQHADNWKQNLKNKFTKIANNISVSHYVASTLKGKSSVIHNFVDQEFRITDQQQRTIDFCFLGRLVSDKGADALIQAFAQLYQNNPDLRLTIIGEGPDFFFLERMVDDLNLREAVRFTGPLTGQALVTALNQHKVLVAPSRWKEPFGLIALEGLACGCKVVCSNEGGLPEAVGNLGFLCNSHDIEDLSRAMLLALQSPVQEASVHLQQFNKSVVAQAYLNHFRQAFA
jgi:glycosyltransferase involved in cell wall biosynthesis